MADKCENTFGPTKIQRGLKIGYFDAVAVIDALKKAGIARPVGENPHVIEIVPLRERIEKIEVAEKETVCLGLSACGGPCDDSCPAFRATNEEA